MSISGPSRPGATLRLGWRKKLLFSICTCVLLLGGIEVSWRLVRGWNRTWTDLHRWNPVLGWSPRESWVGTENWTGGFSRINAQGIRDDRPVGPRAAGEKRLLVLGDSTTFGYRVRTEQAFPAQLEKTLLAAGCSWRVLNGGVCSYDAAQEADWLELFGWKLEPNVLAIAFCRNDIYPSLRLPRQPPQLGTAGRWLTEHSLVTYKLQHHIWEIQARLGLSSATGQPAPAGAQGDSPQAGWPFVEHAYRRIAQQAGDRQTPVILFIYPTLQLLEGRESDDLSERLQALGRELGWHVIDLASSLAKDPASLFFPGDPVHPNATGYHRAALYAADDLLGHRVLP